MKCSELEDKDSISFEGNEVFLIRFDLTLGLKSILS